ncbi:LPS export ABC transporter permease LptG [Fangia hongkongensis]|uniref:LPS export ABC transporter permease LptG n=1 Tax=Fangia hongkongensis TaxID=270495 RepID=UPI0003665A4E|nr:LPS export ABC transporter permease LptG [Fangia hongkongensis]MBK2125084.1 LPS export ABC transporter permease LptG [Fangia hongkongensis]
MRKLTLYVASTVLYTSFIMILALTAIFFIFTYINQAGDIGQGNYSALDAFLFVLYDAPANIYLIMPVCALLGGMMGLGLLAHNSELIVMRASGQSIAQIAKGVLLAASILALLTFLMGAYIAPYFQKKAAVNKTLATGGNQALVLYDTQSIWVREGNSFIHVGKNEPNGQLRNITRFEVSNNELDAVSFGKNAEYKGKQWHVQDVNITKINQQSASTEHKAQDIWNNLLPPSLLKIITSNTDYLNLNELVDYIKANKEESQSANRIWLKFWQMFFQPLSLLILMLISVPFSLGSQRSSAMGYKLVLGMLFGFSFYIINQTFGPFSLVYNLPAFLGAAIPSFIFLILLAFLFWKMKE